MSATPDPIFTSDPDQYQECVDGTTTHNHATEIEGDENFVPNVALKPNREEKVEEASWESFPASDPPGWAGNIT